MPKLHWTSWLIAAWTTVVALLAVATLNNPELRYFEIFLGAMVFTGCWLVGLVPLTILWVVSFLRRGGRERLGL